MSPQKQVLCIGDLILDKFVEGKVERISPEAPIPVIRETGHHYMLGAAGNVIRNIASLEHSAMLISVVDTEKSGQRIQDLLSLLSPIKADLLKEETWLTPYKTRFTAQGQQLLRYDQEKTNVLTQELERWLLKKVEGALPQSSLVILSDYNKGLLTPSFCQAVIKRAQQQKISVIVDPKGTDFSKYKGAFLITPNLGELRTVTRSSCHTEEDITKAAQTLKNEHDFDAVLVTRGAEGMTLIEKGNVSHIPSQAREVFDVSGAGDTVIATLSVSLSEGFSLSESCKRANKAGGIVVGKVGTAVIYRHELESSVPSTKIHPLTDLLDQVQKWRRQGYKVGFTNGCFDLLHLGHLHTLRESKALCDRLIVALNSDASVKRLKGETRPIQPEHVRAHVLEALEFVDGVVLFHEETPLNLIEAIVPDVLIKGADYTVASVVGADIVLKAGGEIKLIDLKQGYSTTSTIEKMRRVIIS